MSVDLFSRDHPSPQQTPGGRDGRCCADMRTLAGAAALLSIALMSACTSPGAEVQAAARAQAMTIQVLPVGGLEVTAHVPAPGSSGSRWHVYLEGDGLPWWQGRVPAADPTGLRGIMPSLMAQDPAPRLLLHRPCYARERMPAGCEPGLWTDARYGEAVVAALDSGLDRLAAEQGIQQVVLIGFSGGGTLARLLAARRNDVVALITVSANLDHDLWSRLHGYRPLQASMRVRDTPPLPAGILQWHLAGGADTTVPPQVVRQGVAHDPHARVRELEGFDHHCCWAALWPTLLEELEHALNARPSAAH